MITASLDARELERAADTALAQIDRAIEAGVERGLEEIAREAGATSAFRDRTGRLRASIRANEVTSSRDGAAGEVEADAGHASFLEGGTRRVDAHPFLEPALDTDDAVEGFVDELERALERAGW